MKSILKYDLNKKDFIQNLLRQKQIQDIDLFLNPYNICEEDVYHLENIRIGINSLQLAIECGSRIGILIDEDADGFLSSALLYFFFKYIQYDNIEFIFHNQKSHGIILEEIPNSINFLICPDAATSDYLQHEELLKEKIDILILDHHEAIEGESSSLNVCTINNQLSPLYNNKYLCGTGITFKFLKEYCIQQNINLNMDNYLDLVAIAIVGDVMNLSTLENRYYVSEGLENIQNSFFKSLVEKRAFSIGSSIPTPTDVAFYIIPALNAIIRMGNIEEKKILFNAITNGDIIVPSTKRGHKPDDTEILKEQAIRLCDNAIARQKRERTKIAELLSNRIYSEGYEQDKIIIGKYYDSDNINSNLTGLAAMELATTFQRPALVVHYNKQNDEWSGSARNFGSAIYDLKEFLSESQLLTLAAGHAGAFGISFPNNDLDALREYFNKKLENINYTEDNVYEVDLETTVDDPWLISIISQIDKYKGIWGKGIEEPLLYIKNIPLYHKDIIIMGNNGDSFKFIKNGIAFVKFKDLEFYDNIMNSEEPIYLNIIAKANMNYWQGHSTPQLFIQDYNIENIYDF